LGSVIVYDSLTNNLNAAFDSVGHLMPNIAFNYGIATPYPHKFGGKDSVLFLYGTQTGGLMGVHVSKQDTAVEDDDQDTTDPSVRRPRKAFKHQLKVYPNPASQRVRIDAPAPTQLRIIDMRGRTVAQRRIDDPTQPLSMDVQDWAPGIYTLHFYWSGHSAYKRLMISGH
jgi:hypothetical protein